MAYFIGEIIGVILAILFFVSPIFLIVLIILRLKRKKKNKPLRIVNRCIAVCAILFAISIACVIIFIPDYKNHETSLSEDTYQNYKKYNCHNVFTYKVPKSWKYKKIGSNFYYYKNKNDDCDGMLMVNFTKDVGNIEDNELFQSYVDGVKSSKEYNGGLAIKNVRIGSINARRIKCRYKFDGKVYNSVSTIFSYSDGIGSISFLTYDSDQYSNYYKKIINSLVISKPASSEPLDASTEVQESTTEVTTSETQATTETHESKPQANTSEMVDYIARKAKSDSIDATETEIQRAIKYIRKHYPNYFSNNKVMEKTMYYGYYLEYANYDSTTTALGMDTYQAIKYVYRGAEKTTDQHVTENLRQIKKSLNNL